MSNSPQQTERWDVYGYAYFSLLEGLSTYEDHGLRENPGDAGKSESVTTNNFNLIPLINTYVKFQTTFSVVG